MNDIGIRKMRVFMAAVEEGSFTRASVQQNITQPAATIIINQIEEAVDAELFVRQGNSRKAVLTEIGQKVAETFALILSSYDAEFVKIGQLRTKEKEICTVLIQAAYAPLVSAHWMGDVIDAFDDYTVSFEQCARDVIVERIKARRGMIGLIDGEMSDANIDYQELATLRLVLSAPEGLIAAGDIALSDLPDDTVISIGLSEASERRLLRTLTEAGRAPSSFMRVAGYDVLESYLEEKSVPVLLPEKLAEEVTVPIGHVIHPLKETLIQVPVGLITSRGLVNNRKIGAAAWRAALKA